MAAMNDADGEIDQTAHRRAVLFAVGTPEIVDKLAVVDGVAGKQRSVPFVEQPDRTIGVTRQMQHAEAAGRRGR